MKTPVFLTAALIFANLFFSCKKGEDDPVVSLNSRKARLAGNWHLTEATSSFTTVSFNNNGIQTGTFISDYKLLNDIWTSTNSNSGGNSTVSGGTSITSYVFKRNGTYISTVEEVNQNGLSFTKVSTKEKTEGSWDFLKGVGKEYRNKERIVLLPKTTERTSIQSSSNFTSTIITKEQYNESVSSEVWILKELRNRKMVVELRYSYKMEQHSTSLSGSSFSENRAINTEEGFANQILTQ
jgi:hypothetical protein